MFPDFLTPYGFDLLLIATTVPLFLVAVALFWIRFRRYLRFKGSQPDQRIEAHQRRGTTIYLEQILDSFFWVSMAVALLCRPLAEVAPTDTMTTLERLIAPGVRIIGTIIGIVLIWQEHNIDRG